MKKVFLFVFIVILSCKEKETEKRIPMEPDNGIGNGAVAPALSFSENIEEAHNKSAFRNNKAISFDINLNFGGAERLNATVSATTNSKKLRLDKANGTSIIYDGKEVFLTPQSAETPNARFDIFTWPYFFALPFKLTDPGTVWEEQGEKKIDSLSYKTAKLSFKSDIGDSPDDWYIIYQDMESRRLKAAAYIVTFGKEQKQAEENPHAIVYSNYEVIEEVPFAKKWEFYSWSKKNGFGEKIGEAEISNISFFSPEKGFFSKPENSKRIEK